MKIYANLRSEVDVDPVEFLETLLRKRTGGDWVKEEDGRYYLMEQVGGGNHSWDRPRETSKDFYDYIKALELVIKEEKARKV